nr:E3 ubiquitin-protein ligase UPL5 [Tanacetum cinerariifolium]
MLAPVVLHFCVLIRQVLVTHVEDDLYVFFGTTLGSMLSDYAWFSTSTSKIALYDIFTFVDELAYNLSNDLVESVNSVIGTSETDVRDFKAFVWFLLAALVDPMDFETLIPVHYHHNHPWGDKDYKWILDRKDMTDFKSRRHLAMMLLPEIVGEMSAEQRKVLFFWTSVKYLPVEEFSGLASRLYITNSNGAIDRLPSSHTCFYRICFPPYPSMTLMQQRLNIITQEHIG